MEHPDTLYSWCRVASLESIALNYEEALEIYARTFESCKRGLGEDHWYSIQCAHGLLTALISLKDSERALPLALKALKDKKQAYGESHAKTLRAMERLAKVYSIGGRVSEAAPLLRLVIQIRKRRLGPKRPETIRASWLLINLGINLTNLERLSCSRFFIRGID